MLDVVLNDGSALNAGFVLAEVVFDLTARSVALLADAAHNFGDVSACCWHWAAWLGRHPTRSRTYGYGRSYAVVLLVGIGGITVEAIHRLIDGVPAGEVDP